VKKIVIALGTVVVLAGIAVAVYAAYDVSGSSPAENFTAGSATNLAPDPEEGDLAGILPGETKNVDVWVYNPNTVGVHVTGVDLVISSAGVCDLTTAPWSGNYPLPGSTGDWWVVAVHMGDPAPGCEGAGLTVSATASGTMP
jgi:hypothetical protein